MKALLRGTDKYAVHRGDCIEHMAHMPEHSVDFSVFSPPFPALFAYTNEPGDIGNSENLRTDSKLHFAWFFKQLIRVIKPGRVVMVHVMQIPKLARSGEKGTFDFRGLVIKLAERAGFHYHFDWAVTKNPQAQAIRTHASGLLFVTLGRDRATTRGAFPDYLIKLQAPGDNAVPINSDEITRQEWIDWAEAVWTWGDIRDTDTLNTLAAKSDNDTRHICPLQLPVIRRLVKLYSNPGEIVFSPFTGIGSEGYESLKLGRRFYGCELKPEYYEEALRNLAKAQAKRESNDALLWDELDAEDNRETVNAT